MTKDPINDAVTNATRAREAAQAGEWDKAEKLYAEAAAAAREAGQAAAVVRAGLGLGSPACPECGKHFDNEGQLDNHQRIAHPQP